MRQLTPRHAQLALVHLKDEWDTDLAREVRVALDEIARGEPHVICLTDDERDALLLASAHSFEISWADRVFDLLHVVDGIAEVVNCFDVAGPPDRLQDLLARLEEFIT